MKNKKKTKDFSSVKCPYCGGTTSIRPAGAIRKNHDECMYLVCNNYPACDAYVKCHKGTRIPMGIPANAALRKKRQQAHGMIDLLEKQGIMTKDEIYYLLRKISLDGNCHIGGMGEYACDLVIRELQKILDAAQMIAAGKAS